MICILYCPFFCQIGEIYGNKQINTYMVNTMDLLCRNLAVSYPQRPFCQGWESPWLDDQTHLDRPIPSANAINTGTEPFNTESIWIKRRQTSVFYIELFVITTQTLSADIYSLPHEYTRVTNNVQNMLRQSVLLFFAVPTNPWTIRGRA